MQAFCVFVVDGIKFDMNVLYWRVRKLIEIFCELVYIRLDKTV